MPEVLVIRGDGPFSELLRDAGFSVSNLELIRTEPVDDLSELDARIDELEKYDGLFFTSSAAAEIFVRRFDASGAVFRPKAYVLGERSRTVMEQVGFEIVGDSRSNTAEELLASFDDSEFEGKTFLFVRGSRSLGTIARRLGPKAEIHEVTVYRTVELTHSESTLGKIRQSLGRTEIAWACFFSPSGVMRFTELFGTEAMAGTSVAVIGKTTETEARKAGMNVRFVAQKTNAEDFATELIEFIKTH